jgi:hypothetical protein
MIWKKGKNSKSKKHDRIKTISKNLKIKEHIVTTENKKRINVKIDETVGEGVYANFFMINNSPSEFVIDFGRILPGLPNAKIYSRILTTPQHAKQLLQILGKNIENFEKKNGEIKMPGKQEEKDIGFKNIGQNA